MADQLLTGAFNLQNGDKPKSFRELVEQRKNVLGIGSDFELSKMVGIANNTLVRIIDGENKKVDLFSVLKISQFLGIELSDMVEVYAASLPPESVGELEIAAKANYILKNFNLTALKKLKFIKDVTDFKAIDERITKFFGLRSIYLYSQDILPPTLFSKIKRYTNDEMLLLWQMGAYAMFEKFNNPNAYDRDALVALIPKIRAYTQYEETGLLMVIRALYKIGITVIVQQYLSLTSTRGASFIVEGKPCIVITDYKKTYATLWFTLLHELCHILMDYKELVSWGSHCSGEQAITNDLFNEERANEFAHERLFPKNKLDYIRPMISSPSLVNQFAAKNKVHPGIIYSFYCYQEKMRSGADAYAFYQHFFGKSDIAIKMIKVNAFSEEQVTVDEGIDKIKTIYEYTS